MSVHGGEAVMPDFALETTFMTQIKRWMFGRIFGLDGP
jgi:hypothetical protein